MLADAVLGARRGAFSELQSAWNEAGARTIPEPIGRIQVCKWALLCALRNEGEQEIEDMDSSGAAGAFDCDARGAAGDDDVLRTATGRAGDSRAGATAGRGAEAAEWTAAAFGRGETAGASAAGYHRGAIERREY
jgi:hypothetical protein